MTPDTSNITMSDVASVIGSSIFSTSGSLDFCYSCSFLRQAITENPFDKIKCRLILNRISAAAHRRISDNSLHRFHSNVDCSTVDCNCVFPNKTATRTTDSNNGSSTINTDTSLKTNKISIFLFLFLKQSVYFALITLFLWGMMSQSQFCPYFLFWSFLNPHL